MTGPEEGSGVGSPVSSILAEWARDHYLGPAVCFGGWSTHSPPAVGGAPGFLLTVPSGSLTSAKARTGYSRAEAMVVTERVLSGRVRVPR